MTLTAGTKLGPYEILSPLGAGGMGEVYRARDTRLAREVAIKVLPESLASDVERLRRFEKEARSASALNHPNIVTIHDIGSESGVSYIAMELVEGATLRELLASGPLPIKKLLQIAPQVAEGLARAHEAGIVHRDLKPENVMVKKDGLVKILDFGLAKLSSTGSGSDEASQLPTMTGTQPGVVVGTVSYMSPEQASGQTVDFRSDQFSLGSMLYEMATGRRAFQKKTAIDTLAAILNEEPEPVSSINPQTPAPVRWIVQRCLGKEPRRTLCVDRRPGPRARGPPRSPVGGIRHCRDAAGSSTTPVFEAGARNRARGHCSARWRLPHRESAFATRRPAAFPESHVSAWDGPASPFRARRSDRRVRDDRRRGRSEDLPSSLRPESEASTPGRWVCLRPTSCPFRAPASWQSVCLRSTIPEPSEWARWPRLRSPAEHPGSSWRTFTAQTGRQTVRSSP